MNLKQIVGSHLHMSHFNQYCFIFEDESMCVWNKMKSYRQSPVVEKDKMIWLGFQNNQHSLLTMSGVANQWRNMDVRLLHLPRDYNNRVSQV